MSNLDIHKFKHNKTGALVEAVYFFDDKADVPAIAEWCNGRVRVGGRYDGELMTIMTNGDVRAATEDMWIFKDEHGDFYPSEDEVFTEMYTKQPHDREGA